MNETHLDFQEFAYIMAQVSSCQISWNTCICHRDQDMPLCCQCIYSCVLMHTVWSCSITGALMMSSGITAKLVKALPGSRWGVGIQAQGAKGQVAWKWCWYSYICWSPNRVLHFLTGKGREPPVDLHVDRSRILRTTHQEEVPRCHYLISSNLCCDFILAR